MIARSRFFYVLILTLLGYQLAVAGNTMSLAVRSASSVCNTSSVSRCYSRLVKFAGCYAVNVAANLIYNQYDLKRRKARVKKALEMYAKRYESQSKEVAEPETLYSFGCGNGASSGWSHALSRLELFLGKICAAPDFADCPDGYQKYHPILRELFRLTTCLGQDRDAQKLAQEVKLFRAGQSVKLKDAQEIALGVSRGGAAQINRLAGGGGDDDDLSRIAGAVLEVPLATVRAPVKNILRQFGIGYIPGVSWLLHKLTGILFPYYRPWGLEALDVVHLIPQHIPIFLVGVWPDELLVPEDNILPLYKKLCQTGRDNVYLLMLPHGDHNAGYEDIRFYRDQSGKEVEWWNRNCDCELKACKQRTCGMTYQHFVNSFYSAYNLPCRGVFQEARGTRAEELKRVCQPDPNLSTKELKAHFDREYFKKEEAAG